MNLRHPLLRIGAVVFAGMIVLAFVVGPATRRDRKRQARRDAVRELVRQEESMELRIDRPADCEEVIAIDRGKDNIKLVYRTAGNDIVIKTYTLVEETAKMSEWLAEKDKKKE